MKHNDQRPLMASSAEQFGLGIQVFKIDSKAPRADEKNRQRKAIQHIQNPAKGNNKELKHFEKPGPARNNENQGFTRSSAPIPKKPHVLPSISAEKKMVGTYQEDDRERRATLEKKKKSSGMSSTKEVVSKKVMTEKRGEGNGSLKNVQPQSVALKERQIVYVHPRQSFNDLENFYQKIREAEADNIREIRRLRKEKEGEDLEWRMRCKDDSRLLAEWLASEETFPSTQEEEFQEYDLTTYMKGNCSFSSFCEEQAE